MPEIGEIRSAREIGKGSGVTAHKKYRYSTCPDCGEERWVNVTVYRNTDGRCVKCGNRLKDARLIRARVQTLRAKYPEAQDVKWLRYQSRATTYLLLLPCKGCGDLRWVREDRAEDNRCKSCAGKARRVDARWKNPRGYIQVAIPVTHPFVAMASKKGVHYLVLEHRLVMAQERGRVLLSTEQVHHINGDRADNRADNLQLLRPSDHNTMTALCSDCVLRTEIRLLRWELSELKKLLSHTKGD